MKTAKNSPTLVLTLGLILLLAACKEKKDLVPKPTPSPIVIKPTPPGGQEKPLMEECPPPIQIASTPIEIKQPFDGNGHMETWDGRVFIAANHDPKPPYGLAFIIRVLRPERIESQGGYPDFTRGAFSDSYRLEGENTPGSGMTWVNALAGFPAPGFPENPFRSDGQGNPNRGGNYLTYELIIVTQHYLLKPDNTLYDQVMGQRRARVILRNPHTPDAGVHWAGFLEPFQTYQTVSGKPIHGMEPSMTFDGHLLIYQGHPDNNDGRIDNIMYSYNPVAGAVAGWSEPKRIGAMHLAEANTKIGGIPFRERYPLAAKPLKDFEGRVFGENDPYPGAYPWVTLDGTEIFHTAGITGVPDEDRTRRGGYSVIGRWTGYVRRHIDGPINPNREGQTKPSRVRLFFSSPGAFPSMWQPYRDVPGLPIPYSPQRPVFPLFGSNTSDYNEITFEDFVDGNYVLFLHLNEAIDRHGNYQALRTQDTSGQNHQATLSAGALFPLEYNRVDLNQGVNGQAVYFSERGRIQVTRTPALDSFPKGFTLQFFVKRIRDMAQDPANRYLFLAHKPGSFYVVLEESGLFSASLAVNGAERRLAHFGNPAPLDTWTHVAITYDPVTGALTAYQDGALVASQTFGPGNITAGTSDLILGPGGQNPSSPFVPDGQAVFMLDEVAISKVARTAEEITVANFRGLPSGPYDNQLPLPLGLRPSELRIPASNPALNTAAVELGHKLFFETRLSADGKISCATCHQPSKGFGDGLKLAQGLNGKTLQRNTPTVINRAFSDLQFWDGRSRTLEEQVLVPLTHPDEMGLSLEKAEQVLNSIPGYVALFRKAFGQSPTAAGISAALATFQRTILSGNSPVDRYEAGDLGALTESELRGRNLFFTKARCVGCHNGSNYTDEQFHHTAFQCKVSDEGRKTLTGRESDFGKFKTPTLRDVALTAPYLHNGRARTLEEVIDIYNVGGLTLTNRDPEIKALGLSVQEKSDLAAFLRALTGNVTPVEEPSLPN